ncbi:MAG TPA: phosphodiester glycosidase family protein [Acidimicrobiia bacterium]|nr:phosphodiester glycosidase family protein [Acidimicrobiia bacterium]
MTTTAVDVATTEHDPDLERFWQRDPRSAKGLRRAKRKERWARRSPGYRFFLRALPLAAFLLMFQAGWSYVHALTAPGTDPWSVRSVEWVRDHGGGGIVNRIEHWWYTNHPPPVGGRPEHGLPRSAKPGGEAIGKHAKVLNTPTPTAPPAPPHLAPPGNLPPFTTPLPGEGVWSPTGRTVKGLPGVYATFMRPDPVHTSLVTGIAWMDTKLLRGVFVPGLQEPGGGPNPWGSQIPQDQRAGIVAAFNSGFKMNGARGGYYTDGEMVKPLREGAASLVILQDGTINVGMWGRDFAMDPNIKTVRQNLDLMVDGGQAVPGLDSDTNDRWGATLGNKVFVWRSAVGVDAHGGLLYVGGNGLNAKTLGDLLVRAGAVRAMELDINSQWVSYYTYDQVYPDPTAVQGHKLLPDMPRGDDRYLQPGERDFFAMFAR